MIDRMVYGVSSAARGPVHGNPDLEDRVRLLETNVGPGREIKDPQCLMPVTRTGDADNRRVAMSHHLELSLYPGPPSTVTPLQSTGLVIIGP